MLLLFVMLGLGLLAFWVVLNGGTALVGMNDFLCFYSAGALAGSSAIYHLDHMQQIQLARTGMTGDNLVFVRLPYLALLFAPFSHLPYKVAYWLWQALSFTALVLFLRLWQIPGSRLAALFACLSFPLMLVFVTGQDVTFLLLCLSLAVWLHQRRNALVTGSVLALCAAKLHFFLLLPLLVWYQPDRRRLLVGFAAGGAILLMLCFLAGGPDWISAYWTALSDPRPHAGGDHMPNLHGLVRVWHLPTACEWALVALTALLAARAISRGAFAWQLSTVVCAGVLMSFHAYIYDCALLLPVALTAMTQTCYRGIRLASIALLTPAPYLCTMNGYPATTLLLGLLLVGMALHPKQQAGTTVTPAVL